MATLSRGYSFGATEEVTAAKLHSLVDSGSISGIVAADITNGVITNAKIDSVSGAKLTNLASIPAGSGVIPTANIPDKTFTSLSDCPTSITANQFVKGNSLGSALEFVDTLNTSTGHDHDGSDSKKVVATNLDMTGITSTHILYNNGGTLAGRTETTPDVNLVEAKTLSATQTISFTGLTAGIIYRLVFDLTVDSGSSTWGLSVNGNLSNSVYGWTDGSGAVKLAPVDATYTSAYCFGDITFLSKTSDATLTYASGVSLGTWSTLNAFRVNHGGASFNSDADFTTISVAVSSNVSGKAYLYSYAIS